MKAEISLSYRTDKQAKAIADSITPDNVKVPEGLAVKTERREREVLTHIKCRSNLFTFIATIDDLLGAVSVAEKSISTVRNR